VALINLVRGGALPAALGGVRKDTERRVSLMEKSTSFPLQEFVQARQGAECVYWEKGYIIHAELDEIQLDGWGVRLKFRDLYTPGFTGDTRPDAENSFWAVSAAWQVFSYAAESWSAAYGGWSVYFSTPFIETLRETARGVVGADWQSRHEALVNCCRDHRPNE
jgi:hypothetical protein